MAIKNPEGYSALEVFLEEQNTPDPHQAVQPGASEPERGVCITLGWENLWELCPAGE